MQDLWRRYQDWLCFHEATGLYPSKQGGRDRVIVV
jgi:hypothetical protein